MSYYQPVLTQDLYPTCPHTITGSRTFSWGGGGAAMGAIVNSDDEKQDFELTLVPALQMTDG